MFNSSDIYIDEKQNKYYFLIEHVDGGGLRNDSFLFIEKNDLLEANFGKMSRYSECSLPKTFKFVSHYPGPKFIVGTFFSRNTGPLTEDKWVAITLPVNLRLDSKVQFLNLTTREIQEFDNFDICVGFKLI